MPEEQTPPKLPSVIALDQIIQPPNLESLTAATLKYETAGARQAREAKESADAAHERLVTLLKLSYAGVLLLGFFLLGVYLFAFKPDATEAQKLYATTVLTAIASGSAGYAFGKKEGKSEKD